MKKRRLLTREYLEFLGIKDVLEDGTVIGAGGKPITPRDNGNGYKIAGFNRIELGKPFNLYIHHIIWTWFNGTLGPDQEVHHLDKDRANNALSNLIAISQKEHKKLHTTSIKEMKCQMNKPRSFYEDKLVKYEALYEAAEEAHNADLCHSLRANIWQTKARLRYWDSHKEEYFEYVKQTKMNKECKAAKKQSIKDRKILEQYKDMFRKNGNKNMWHQLCDIINKWDTLESMQKKHVFEVLNKHFTLAEQFES